MKNEDIISALMSPSDERRKEYKRDEATDVRNAVDYNAERQRYYDDLIAQRWNMILNGAPLQDIRPIRKEIDDFGSTPIKFDWSDEAVPMEHSPYGINDWRGWKWRS